jgi:tRNA nucleotidyltransferase (CCA-adding enzyme)
MRIYQVGGSLRDELLGLPVSDRDWVVVGATPEAMVEAGFRPVGRDFPVFLHPVTHEEYALARTERKTAPGYTGFVFHASPDVTLEEDLARRDYTVNAMARPEGATGHAELVDPFGGRSDLGLRVLRHVGPAFAEDPVRILRGARFAARLGFSLAPETLELMRHMVAAGEADALVPERVWQELARGLMESDPVAMFAVLETSGALARVAPEWVPWQIDALSMRALGEAARARLALGSRFAASCHGLALPAVDSLCARLRVPNDCRDLARLAARLRERVAGAASLEAAGCAELLSAADVLRQPERFVHLLDTVDAGMKADGVDFAPARRRIEAAVAAYRAVDAGAVARRAPTPAGISAAVHAARVAALREALGG